MGDHRSVSYDSRGHIGDPGGGTIPENQVVGRAFVIMWPPSRTSVLSIPATFKQPKLTASAAAGSAAVAVPLGLAMVLPIGLLRRRIRHGARRRIRGQMLLRRAVSRRVLLRRRTGRW